MITTIMRNIHSTTNVIMQNVLQKMTLPVKHISEAHSACPGLVPILLVTCIFYDSVKQNNKISQ